MQSRTSILENGFEITVMPDYSLPFVEVHGWVKSGLTIGKRRWLHRLVPPMLSKGTKIHVKEKFEDIMDCHALEYGAASSSTSRFFSEFGARALKAHIGELFMLMHESLSCPSFPENELAILKDMLEAELREKASDPEARAEEEIRRMLYGSSHPHFILPTREAMAGLRSVTRDDLNDFWEKRYAPDRAGIVLVGDINLDIIYACLSDTFGKWKALCASGEPEEEAKDAMHDFGSDEYEERTVFIPQKSSAILMLGSRIPFSSTHRDHSALRAAISVLGGGTNGRLFQHVREKHGLSYDVSASLEWMHTMPGYFSVIAHTNPDNIMRTQEEIMRVVSEFYERGISKEELEETKSMLRGTRSYMRSSLKGIAEELVSDKIIGLAASERDERIHRLCASEVNAVISKYLNPVRIKLVRAGTVG